MACGIDGQAAGQPLLRHNVEKCQSTQKIMCVFHYSEASLQACIAVEGVMLSFALKHSYWLVYRYKFNSDIRQVAQGQQPFYNAAECDQ